MRFFLSCVATALLFSASFAQKRYQLPHGISKDQVSDQWVIVKLRDPVSSLGDIRNEVVTLSKSSSERPSVLNGMCKVKVRKGKDPLDLINRLLENTNVLYAEPILAYQPLYLPSDPSNTTNQDYLNQISAPAAWDITRGDDDITIGIIDTGIDLDHEDLKSSIWLNVDDPIDGLDNDGNGYIDDLYGYDFADGDNDPNADGGSHGTRVGALAGADTDNSVGISGVGFNSKIAALKGFKTVGTESSNLFEAIIYAADNGIQVLNLSWGSLRDGLQSEQDIINYAVLERNVVVIAAAGNTNVDGKFHPASYDHVLSVGAVSADDNKWSNSTFNYSVDLMAPGVAIYSAQKDDEYGVDNGTSYAAPMVAGAAALVLSEFPALNAQQVMERLRISTDDIYEVGANSTMNGKLGSGRLNVFNAVSQGNLKSLRATNFQATTSLGPTIYFGDTVSVTADFTNFLSPLNNPLISISSPDNNFTPLQTSLSPGKQNTLATATLAFDLLLDSALNPNSPIAIRLDYSDGTYADFQFLETVTGPDHFDMGDHFKMTVAGNGNLGFVDPTFQQGIGATFNENTILNYAGIILATSETNLSDNLVADYSLGTREQDFTNRTNFKLLHHPAADQFAFSTFEDQENQVLIEQSVFAFESEDFILLRYRVVNNSSNDLADFSIGFYSDFNLNDGLSNRAEFEANEGYLLTKDFEETLFSGSKLLGAGTARHAVLDIGSSNGNPSDIESTFSDAQKFDFLVNQQIDSAGVLGNGNDVAVLNGLTFGVLPAFGSEVITVILAASTSKSGLESTLLSAENKVSEIEANPRVLESILGCAGSSITIDPTSGENFRFYEDAAGSILLAEGSSLSTGIISSDSMFFAQNIDSAFVSGLFQIQIKLVENVANFSMSTDTLYLDNVTNVVSFEDQSFQATSWLWDFGQGTTTILQNPSLTFTSPGTYDVSLSVENEAGCSDTIIKTLVVADRPESPLFESFIICPNDHISLNDPTADFLNIYNSNESLLPINQGTDLIIGPITSSTVLYVSGVYDGFESLRVPVPFNLVDFPADLSVEIDTVSNVHQVIARSLTDQSTWEWFIDDTSVGSAETLTIASSQDKFTLRLDVTNETSCTISTTEDFQFSSSATPSQSDLIVCSNEQALIKPGNGEIFGFYNDESLTSLIKKGSELTITEDAKVFVVGLDDGLPSTAIEVNIMFEVFDLEIKTTSEIVSDQNKVSFSTTPSTGLHGHKWYVDGSLAETSPAPVLFFENTSFEIILEALNSNGCTQRDTIQLDFTAPTPPLGFTEPTPFVVSPNPSDGQITIAASETLDSMTLWDISGKKQLRKLAVSSSLDLTQFPPGIYILKARSAGKTYQTRVIVTR